MCLWASLKTENMVWAKNFMKMEMLSQLWWHMRVIPALRWPRQDHLEFKASPGLHIEFKLSLHNKSLSQSRNVSRCLS